MVGVNPSGNSSRVSATNPKARADIFPAGKIYLLDQHIDQCSFRSLRATIFNVACYISSFELNMISYILVAYIELIVRYLHEAPLVN